MWINLRQQEEKNGGLSRSAVVIIAGIMLITAIAGDYLYLQWRLSGINRELEGIERQLADYRPGLEKYDFLKSRYQGEDRGYLWDGFIEELGRSVPDRVRLNRVQLVDRRLLLEGQALERSAVNILLEKLETSPGLLEIELMHLDQGEQTEFQIGGRLGYDRDQ